MRIINDGEVEAVTRSNSTLARERVSVVVPIYNIESLLENCVRSVLRQTHQAIEVVLVDDGSTDRSGQMCDEIARTDERVVVIHQPNGGLSDARNCGIGAATGEFITFIDGDDFVSEDYVELLLEPFAIDGVDLSSIGFVRVLGDSLRSTLPGTAGAVEFGVWEREHALKQLFLQRGMTTSAWGKMCRRELLDGIEYPVGAIHEDLPVTHRLVSRARRVAVVHAVAYYYVQRSGSITAQADVDRRLPAVRFALEAIETVRLSHPALEPAARVRAYMECVYLVSQVPRARLNTLDPLVVDTMRANRKVVLRASDVPLGQRLAALAFCLGPRGVWLLAKLRMKASHLRTTMRSRALKGAK